MSNREAAAASERLSEHDVLELVRDLSSQEWQDASGKRFGATDNQGRRLWFISEDVMHEVRAALASAPQAVRMDSTRITQQAVLVVACYDDLPTVTLAEERKPEDPRITAFVSAISALRAALIVPLAPQDSTKEGGK
jgi:hypothetical protein